MRTLVIFYSLTGNTNRVASKIAALLDADIEQIVCKKNYHGFFGFGAGIIDSLRRASTPIKPVKASVQDYDLVILAGPIWAGRFAPPFRSYLETIKVWRPELAFVLSAGGTSGSNRFDQMASLCNKKPIETLAVSRRQMMDGTYDIVARDFVKRIQERIAALAQSVATI